MAAGEGAAAHGSGGDSVGLPMSLPIDSILFNKSSVPPS